MIKIHIGPLPPTINGISVYLYRLSKIKSDSQFINWNKISSFKIFFLWFVRKILKCPKKYHFIYHPPSINQKLLIYFLSWTGLFKYSLFLHGNPIFIQYNKSSLLTRVFLRKMLKRANFIQVVNPLFKKIIKNYLGINTKIKIKNAFIPPLLYEEEEIWKTYEKELVDFLETHNPLLMANASGILFYRKKDLYGLDLSIKLTESLKQTFPNVGFIFAIADPEINKDYLLKMSKLIKDLGLEKNFFLLKKKRIWPLFKKIDLMIRPTNRDGYGSSVAEALYFNCPSIASDVCKRPEGAIIFKNRDFNDLYQKCIKILRLKSNENINSLLGF